ncbi:MAG TPA: PEGA domain-containing protein, partial [Polyangiaceae bacterium]
MSVQLGSARTSRGRFPGAFAGWTVVLALFWGAASAPATCLAQEGTKLTARDHFERGVAASREGNLESALEHFEKAYAQSPNPIVLYNLGQTYSGLGRAAEATRALRRYIEGDNPPANAKRRAEVEELLRFNERRVGSLVVTLDPADSGLEVDGAPVDRDTSGKIVLTAGRHVVTAEHAGHRPAMRSIDLHAGEEISVQLSPEPLHAAVASGAFLEIACRVPDASVFVDDVGVGRTPLAHLVAVAPGGHGVRFVRSGYRGAVIDVTASVGAPTRASCNLDADPALPSSERGTL